MSEYQTCSHVKVNGSLCQSPALQNDRFCYFHRDARQRYKRQVYNERHYKGLSLPLPEDRESLQMSLHEVMLAVAKGRIDHKQAGLLLYGLQLAIVNAKHDLEFARTQADGVATEYSDQQASLDREIEEEREAEIESIASKHATVEAAAIARRNAQEKLDREIEKVLPPKKPAKDETFYQEILDRTQQKTGQLVAAATGSSS